MSPDKEKLLAVADAVDAIPEPSVSPAVDEYLDRVMAILVQAGVAIRQIVEEMQ